MAVRVLREADTGIPSEVIEFAKKIDFKGLNKILSDYLGYKVNLTPGKIQRTYIGGEYYYEVSMNENLANKCGIMSKTFKIVKLELGTSSIFFTSRTGDISFFCTVHFIYEMTDGRTNDAHICVAEFTEEHGWDYKMD